MRSGENVSYSSTRIVTLAIDPHRGRARHSSVFINCPFTGTLYVAPFESDEYIPFMAQLGPRKAAALDQFGIFQLVLPQVLLDCFRRFKTHEAVNCRASRAFDYKCNSIIERISAPTYVFSRLRICLSGITVEEALRAQVSAGRFRVHLDYFSYGSRHAHACTHICKTLERTSRSYS
jgi:hypothetical protein